MFLAYPNKYVAFRSVQVGCPTCHISEVCIFCCVCWLHILKINTVRCHLQFYWWPFRLTFAWIMNPGAGVLCFVLAAFQGSFILHVIFLYFVTNNSKPSGYIHQSWSSESELATGASWQTSQDNFRTLDFIYFGSLLLIFLFSCSS